MKSVLYNFKKIFAKENRVKFVFVLLLAVALGIAIYVSLTTSYDKAALYKAMQAGDYAEIIKDYEPLLVKHPSDVFLINQVAAAYIGQAIVGKTKKESINKAISLLIKALKVDPKNSESMLLRGYAYFVIGVYGPSEQFYQKSAEISANNPLVWASLGQLYEIEGLFEKADSFYNKALAIDKTNISAKIGKIRGQIRSGSTTASRADAVLLQKTKLDNLSKASLDEIIGLIDLRTGNYDSSESYFSRALALNPNLKNSLLGYSMALLAGMPKLSPQGIIKQATQIESLANSAIALDASSTSAYAILSRVESFKGNTVQASIYAKKVLELLPHDYSLSKADKDNLKRQFAVDNTSISGFKIISVQTSDTPPKGVATSTKGSFIIKQIK